MRISGLFQSPSDKADIVGSTTTTTGLADDHSKMIGIIFTGQDGIHNLTDNDQRWVACVIVYVFQTHINGLLIVVGQYTDLIACCPERRLQQFKMDR